MCHVTNEIHCIWKGCPYGNIYQLWSHPHSQKKQLTRLYILISPSFELSLYSWIDAWLMLVSSESAYSVHIALWSLRKKWSRFIVRNRWHYFGTTFKGGAVFVSLVQNFLFWVHSPKRHLFPSFLSWWWKTKKDPVPQSHHNIMSQRKDYSLALGTQWLLHFHI